MTATDRIEWIAAIRELDVMGDYYTNINAETAALLRRAYDTMKAVEEHHNQKADDRCIEDDDRLYAAAGLPPCDRRVGSKAEMLANCARYIDRRCDEGGWPTYKELEEENKRLKDEIESRRHYERPGILDAPWERPMENDIQEQMDAYQNGLQRYMTLWGVELKENAGKSMAAAPIMTRDNRILCYSCYNDDDTAALDYWIPRQPENFPCECEKCGLTMLYD